MNQLQKIIDTVQMDADAGCHWSQGLIINAEIEKEEICNAIDELVVTNFIAI